MAMSPLCRAIDDSEVMFLRALLQHEEIPYTIVGENFGSLFPGLQIASYNERRFLVPEEYLEEAMELLSEHRSTYAPAYDNLEQEPSPKSFFQKLFGLNK